MPTQELAVLPQVPRVRLNQSDVRTVSATKIQLALPRADRLAHAEHWCPMMPPGDRIVFTKSPQDEMQPFLVGMHKAVTQSDEGQRDSKWNGYRALDRALPQRRQFSSVNGHLVG